MNQLWITHSKDSSCADSRSLEGTAFPAPSVSFSSGIVSFLTEFQGIPWW